MRFYFNHITGLPEEDYVGCFENLLYNYRTLSKRRGLTVEKGIVTYDDPKDIAMGHLSLGDIIKNVRDKDLKRWIYSQFDRYPASLHYELEEVYKHYNEIDYTFYIKDLQGNHIDATPLLAPARLQWAILTMPVSETWKRHEFDLLCEQEPVSSPPLLSFHGDDDDNFNFVCRRMIAKDYVDENLDSAESKIAWLRNCIGKHEIKISLDFEEQFSALAVDEQKNSVKLIQTAFSRQMLFPATADNILIKKCKGKGNENTYELRDIGKGIRIYFQSKGNTLFLGAVHTKAEGDGTEQSADINHASRIIKEIISKNNIPS